MTVDELLHHVKQARRRLGGDAEVRLLHAHNSGSHRVKAEGRDYWTRQRVSMATDHLAFNDMFVRAGVLAVLVDVDEWAFQYGTFTEEERLAFERIHCSCG